MLHLLMPPFDFGKAQAQFGSTFKSNTHKNEEQSENKHMEVDLVVVLDLHLTKLEVASCNGIIFSAIDMFGGEKGFIPI